MHTLEQLRDGQLLGSTRLQLRCGLTEFPREIFTLFETLEILDLSGNALSMLPDDLPRLSKLRVIFCSDNLFTELPAILGLCPQLTMVGFKANRIETVPGAALPAQLRWLILTDNRIEVLPGAIGQCRQLQKLMLAANRLRALPIELAHCSKLELLRIAANRLTELPSWLFELPRLTWLAYAGNPFCDARELAALDNCALAGIAWQALHIGQKLGEGASGVIHRAQLSSASNDGQTVAIKLFKGAVTSDGLPRSEMAACIAAGAHPHLIAILGKLEDHPCGVDGLVMALIDAGFDNLAGPPSLASCTRDVYVTDKRFDMRQLLGIALGVASAGAHLHQLGILHGDLYGHNILHTSMGDTLLGDFGAASFFTPQGAHAGALQRLEVRAFGLLLEELLERVDGPATPGHPMQCLAQLGQLKTACLQDAIASRPLLTDIERMLARLTAEQVPHAASTDIV